MNTFELSKILKSKPFTGDFNDSPLYSLLEEVKYGAKYNKHVEVKALERENHSGMPYK